MQEYNRTNNSAKLTEVTKSEPCINCGKPDWCYRLGELTVCKRDTEPADGWHRTEQTDRDGGSYFYAPNVPLKPIRAASKQEFFYPDREGNPLLKVVRIDDGNGKKSFAQYHWNGKRWLKGCPDEIRSRIPIYRYQQIRKAIAQGRTIFFVEGEGVADALHKLGLAATTTLGGSRKYRAYGGYLDDLKGADIVLCPDRDQPGLKHMEMVAEDFPDAQWLYAPPGDFYWQNLVPSGGLDISDWILDGATKEEINALITNKISLLLQAPALIIKKEKSQDIDSNNHQLTVPSADEVYTQKALDALYSDTNWIAVDKQLYRWTGTHYELVSEAAEKARISRWCNSTPVQRNSDRWSYTYAKSSYVEAIWNWLIVSFAVDPALVNPPGLNCLNGVLKIEWRLNVPSWTLVPHDPAVMYTYVGQFEFDPNADPTNCDRLLACLDQPQQEIFIKTLAASLDLKTVRSYRGRSIKALLCKGDGNNGKDSLREVVQLLYGVGVISATVGDFQSYDQGRKFTLAKLEGARISWSSENSSVNQLDNLQSLKAAITGEPLDLERKGVDERVMLPTSVFLFNINNVPNLQASLEAIQSRWAVLSFTKTFKANADPTKGEIEADPRFRYDPQFLQREVVPALLNKMLAVLPEVATNAIDYSCTEAALEEIQRETNHLRAFCQDVGLDYQVGGQVSIREIWEKLSRWYIDNGTAIVSMNSKGNEVLQFLCDPPHRGDKNVKGENQVFQRFQALFPKAKRGQVHSIDEGKKNRVTLDGISFTDIQQSTTDEHSKAVVRQLVRQLVSQQPALGADVRQPKPILPTLLQILDTYSKLSPRDQLSVKKMLLSDSEEDGIGLPGLQSSPSKDQLPYNCLTNCLTTALPNNPPEINANAAKADVQNISDNLGSNVVGGIGNITHDNSTKNFADPSNHKFKIGSKVAHVDPKSESYNWHGRITEINGDEAKVYWEERAQRKIRGGAVLKHSLSELWLI